MLEKLWYWLLGDKWGSSVGGILVGAATGAAATAAAGNVDQASLTAGAIGGAASAVAGIYGRKHGD